MYWSLVALGSLAVESALSSTNKAILSHVLSRNPTRAQTKLKSARAVYGWNPETEKLPSEATSDVKAVVHLAGETIAGRWNAEKKRRIRDSRILSTRKPCRIAC